ncbi:bromodomain-containing protein 9 isoform X19 [Rissa tridactyla]|uniref:bromodomain-containing protein 9 isoform X19 n=1 Tax=Rissa tridactyla TaxID=75485 RepID=UPI0023BABB1A|nr:bromodomain-containing protein 9 isoform X19 [Rissa tridactyla]
MGKKHKKHKAEKAEWRSASATAYSDYVDKPLEKPLKLVLKVGGSEVTELSGSGHDSSYYDDRSDHERERHKEKKKKKKKKSEKEKEKHLDDEERRKRKEEKKRKREKEQCDTEGETDDFDPGKKVEVEPPPDRPVRACRTQPAENESTPIQQLLEHFLRQLQRKDPHGFFAFPVTDAIAPGYSMIIKHPMDFGTMKEKIAANEYKSVTEFKADFKLMCDNAMTYNRPDTVYYKLAKKILHTGFKMMSKIGYLKKNGDGTLLFSVVNSSDPDAEEEETHPVDLSSLSSKLLPGFTTLGFKDERRNKENKSFLALPPRLVIFYTCVHHLSSLSSTCLVTFLTSASTAPSMQNNSIFHDLKSDEMELLYSAYGDETGIQCALSLQEFVKDAGNYSKKIVDDLLDQITSGDHSKTIYQLKQRRNIPVKPLDEVKVLPVLIKEEQKLHNTCPDSSKQIMVGESAGDSNASDLDFLSMKPYSDVSLDISMLSSLGKVKKELDHDDNHLHLDETTKLLQDLHEAQADRVGSRPSSNLSSLSNTSERDQHHLGSPSHLSVGEQQDMVHDPYEFLQSPETSNATTN